MRKGKVRFVFLFIRNGIRSHSATIFSALDFGHINEVQVFQRAIGNRALVQLPEPDFTVDELRIKRRNAVHRELRSPAVGELSVGDLAVVEDTGKQNGRVFDFHIDHRRGREPAADDDNIRQLAIYDVTIFQNDVAELFVDDDFVFEKVDLAVRFRRSKDGVRC